MRYEVAVQTNLAFHARGEFAPPISDLPRQAETVVIEFEGRRFVWHAVPPLVIEIPDRGRVQRARNRFARTLRNVARRLERVVRQERRPTVTTPIDDANDYESERPAMARFLSALAYETGHGMEVVTGGGAGVPAEFDPPVATAVRFGPGSHMQAALFRLSERRPGEAERRGAVAPTGPAQVAMAILASRTSGVQTDG